jgi:ABC-type cobalamin/Fe3+-siderophores transport system ATPase subunit
MPMRLQSLQIKNYRQIRVLEIPELGHVNLVVGANNTGKTTLLEAIGLLASRGSPSVIAEILALHDAYQMATNADGTKPKDKRLDLGRAIGSLFSGRSFPTDDDEAIFIGDVAGCLILQLRHVLFRQGWKESEAHAKTFMAHEQRVPKNDPTAFHLDVFEAIETTLTKREGSLPMDGGPFVFDSVVTPLADFFSSAGASQRYQAEEFAQPIRTSFVPSRFSPQESLAQAWDAIVLTEGESQTIEALQFIEPATQGLAFIQETRSIPPYLRSARLNTGADRFAVIRLQGSPAPIPLQSMGDGMTRVLQLTLAAVSARDGFLLVDEMENGLHYSIQEKVWRLIFRLARTNGMQVFATTHSMDCVRAFAKVAAEDELDGKLLHMERNEATGDAEISSLAEDQLNHLVDAGIEVR